MKQANFGYIIRKKARYHPAKTAVADEDSGYTYGELETSSNAIANWLSSQGVGEGDRICVILHNSIEFFQVFFAACKIGAVTAPINHRLTGKELSHIYDDINPEVVIYENKFDSKVNELQIADIPRVEIGGPDRGGEDSAVTPWKDVLAVQSVEMGIAEGFDKTAVLMYTSGSTGRPKGVPLSHKNLFFSSVSYLVDTNLTEEDASLITSPMFHVGGLNIFNLPLLHTGGTVIVQREFDAERAWDLAEAYDITKLFAIPTILNRMINIEGWQQKELDELELVITGGEPVPDELKDAFARIDVPCVSAYGLTETTDGSLILRPENAEGMPAECNGKTFTHVDAKVVDQDGNECQPGEVGELLHRGPTVADEYYDLPDKTAETWTDDGWFHTGDLAEVDENGFYHIRGRADNMIISGGENIYPGEVENVLYSHERINAAVVFGVPDEEWGEIVKAVIETADGKSLPEEELESFLSEQLAGFKHPKEIVFTDELPQSGTGKVERQTVVEQYGDG